MAVRSLTPREIIKREYGDSRNIFTPRVLGYGRLPGGAYEFSCGPSMAGGTLYGVTVVNVLENGTTARSDRSNCFHSRAAARVYIRTLKKEPR